MIHIHRPARQVPAGLLSGSCQNQILAAARLYQVKGNWECKAKFTSYRDQSVKDSLNALFHKKCAYCESDYKAVGPPDIEHYRPKGAIVIDGKLRRPGYYWLAADWENLLPSCSDCNRRRRTEMAGGPRITSGKANLFPLSNENMRKSRRKARTWKKGAESGERPLLLNPCRDEPSQHLFIDPWGLARARTDRRGRPSKKGATTIEVCGLNRLDLYRSRGAVRSRWESQVDATKWAAQALDEQPAEGRVQGRFANALRELRSFQTDDAPYLLMLRGPTQEMLKLFGGLLRRHRQVLGLATGGRSNRDLVDLFIAAHPSPAEPITDADLIATVRIATGARQR